MLLSRFTYVEGTLLPLQCFVSNSVKQGGIILHVSPILFDVYIDQLSVKLNAPNIGGDIGGGGARC